MGSLGIALEKKANPIGAAAHSPWKKVVEMKQQEGDETGKKMG